MVVIICVVGETLLSRGYERSECNESTSTSTITGSSVDNAIRAPSFDSGQAFITLQWQR
jgi:hypothetical protein